MNIKAILFFFFACTSFLDAQELITGFVKNEDGNPITKARIVQVQDSTNQDTSAALYLGAAYSGYTDEFGAFHLVLDEQVERAIEIRAGGYLSKKINLIKLDENDAQWTLEIVLEEDEAYATRSMVNKNYREKKVRSGGSMTVNLDFINRDFDAFEPLLGKENVNFLNRSGVLISFGLSGTRKRLDYGMEFGFLWTENNNPDSINIELSNASFGLNVGYKLINNKSFVVMPQVAWKRYRYRLINSLEAENDQQLADFVDRPDLDLRIAQHTGFAGARLGYKYRGKKFTEGAYITLGIYGGYLLKFHQAAKVNGLRSVLDTDLEIDFHPLSFGIFMATNFGAEQ